MQGRKWGGKRDGKGWRKKGRWYEEKINGLSGKVKMKDLFENKKEVQIQGITWKKKRKIEKTPIYNINPLASARINRFRKQKNIHNLSGNMFLHFVSSDFEIRLEGNSSKWGKMTNPIYYVTPHLTLSSEANPKVTELVSKCVSAHEKTMSYNICCLFFNVYVWDFV